MNTQSQLPIHYRVMQHDSKIPAIGCVGKIATAITFVTGLNHDNYSSKNRKRNIVEARHIFCYLAKKHNQRMTLEEIAKIVNINHSTVINSIKVTETFNETDFDFRSKLNAIEGQFMKSY